MTPHGLRTILFAALLPGILSQCTTLPSAQDREVHAVTLADKHRWMPVRLASFPMKLIAFTPKQITKDETLTIYIEGDGVAWMNARTPSPDPTPMTPVGLMLAMQHPEGNSAYLARPCQYSTQSRIKSCTTEIWTAKRFTPEVIEASNNAIEQLKLMFGANRLVLVGYSGGGTIAALVSARRPDVKQLVTVAGNLDHAAWTKRHGLTPLRGSLNPADEWERISGIPQTHWVGEKDTNITEALVRSYTDNFKGPNKPLVHVVTGFDHYCCWTEQWASLSAGTFLH